MSSGPRWIHWSANSGLALDRLTPFIRAAAPQVKPAGGLWVSDESQSRCWSEWCKSEGWGLERFKHAYEITLAVSPRILLMSSAYELRGFGRIYSRPIGGSSSRMNVDWDLVGVQYDAVLITPYIWELRLSDEAWYYGWDCASGVILHPRAVQSVVAVHPQSVLEKPKVGA